MINLEVVGKDVPEFTHDYTWRDCALYALGVGASAEDLHLVYERHPGGLKVLPTYAVLSSVEASVVAFADLNVNPAMVLHGEQRVVLHAPIPPEGSLRTKPTVEAIYDKGKGALVVVKAATSLATGEHLFDNYVTAFCRGEGGWGGDRGPEAERLDPPEGKAPDFRVTEKIGDSQNAIYRLSGDLNPLHIDPDLARKVGFDRPILHGLCSFGYMGRAVLGEVCGNDVARLKEIKARFSDVVFPGETLTTEGWDVGGGRFVLRVATERAEVMNQAYAVVA